MNVKLTHNKLAREFAGRDMYNAPLIRDGWAGPQSVCVDCALYVRVEPGDQTTDHCLYRRRHLVFPCLPNELLTESREAWLARLAAARLEEIPLHNCLEELIHA